MWYFPFSFKFFSTRQQVFFLLLARLDSRALCWLWKCLEIYDFMICTRNAKPPLKNSRLNWTTNRCDWHFAQHFDIETFSANICRTNSRDKARSLLLNRLTIFNWRSRDNQHWWEVTKLRWLLILILFASPNDHRFMDRNLHKILVFALGFTGHQRIVLYKQSRFNMQHNTLGNLLLFTLCSCDSRDGKLRRTTLIKCSRRTKSAPQFVCYWALIRIFLVSMYFYFSPQARVKSK